MRCADEARESAEVTKFPCTDIIRNARGESDAYRDVAAANFAAADGGMAFGMS